MMTEIPNKGLTIGSKAPIIDTKDIYDGDINLDNLLEKYRGVMIEFWRGNWWVHCKKHFKSVLIPNHDEFVKRNVILISIAVDSPRKMKQLYERYEIPFKFVADRGAKITKSYNVYLTEEHPDHDQFQVNHAIPSKFLINKEGIIVWQYIGTKTDRPSKELMIEAMDKYL